MTGPVTPPPTALRLGSEIAHCPEMVNCLERPEDETHPCHKVVHAQWKRVPDLRERAARWRAEHHVPEPWAGDLPQARLLFIGPNPAGGLRPAARPPKNDTRYEFDPDVEAVALGHPSAEQHRRFRAPKHDWTTEEVLDRAQFHFKLWVTPRQRPRVPFGYKKEEPSQYWAAVAAQARAILGPVPRPERITP
jgi:hypothetical protein